MDSCVNYTSCWPDGDEFLAEQNVTMTNNTERCEHNCLSKIPVPLKKKKHLKGNMIPNKFLHPDPLMVGQ